MNFVHDIFRKCVARHQSEVAFPLDAFFRAQLVTAGAKPSILI
jgi:hypothetical protein